MIRRPALAVALLCALIFWAPLPFGSVTPGFSATLQVLTFLLVAAAPWLTADVPASRRAPARPAAWVAGALAAVALLGLVQSAPLPAGLVAALSPERSRLGLESAALAGAPPPATLTLSLAPGASRAAAFDWLLAAAALLLGALVGARRRGRRALAVAIVAGAAFQVLFGARQWLVGTSAIWGVETPLHALRLRGTFVNPNHLALDLEIALAVTVAAGWWCARLATDEGSAERRLLLLGVPLLAGLTLAAGLAFTGSRSGLLAGAAGCALEVGLLARGRRRVWVLAGAAAAAAAALAMVVGSGSESGLGRLLATSAPDASTGARLAASARTFDLFLRFPAVGVGLGGFLAAFPLVQGTGLEGTWRHAHDDWLELAATTGAIGTLLFAAALATGLAGLRGAWRRAERSEDRAAVAAAAGALTAVALHSLTDFGLTLPANAFTLAVVAGAALAVAVPEPERPGAAARRKGPPDTPPPVEALFRSVGEPSSAAAENREGAGDENSRRRRRARLAALACATLCAATPLAAGEPWRTLGLIRVRDMTPFGISRLDFLPPHAVVLAPGSMALELNLSYQNTWVASDNVRALLARRPARRMAIRPEDIEAILALPGDAYLVDGEFALLDLTFHYKLDRHLGFYATLPWYDFGRGFLDATIEGFHDALSLPSAERDLVPRDRWQVVAKIGGQQFVSTRAPHGEPGDPVLGLRWTLFGTPERWNLVAELAVKIAWSGSDRLVTTGKDDYGVQLSLQRFFRRNALYLSLSTVYFGAGTEPRLTATAWLPTAIAGWETRLGRRVNFVLQAYASRSAVQDTDLPELSADKLQATAGLQWMWGRQAVRFGITENLIHFENTPDVGVTLSVGRFFGPGGDEFGR